jgi:hypothetical protein
VHADGGNTVVLYGLTGMLVVARPGLTFVTSLDRAAELNPLLDSLPAELSGRVRRDPLYEAAGCGLRAAGCGLRAAGCGPEAVRSIVPSHKAAARSPQLSFP